MEPSDTVRECSQFTYGALPCGDADLTVHRCSIPPCMGAAFTVHGYRLSVDSTVHGCRKAVKNVKNTNGLGCGNLYDQNDLKDQQQEKVMLTYLKWRRVGSGIE